MARSPFALAADQPERKAGTNAIGWTRAATHININNISTILANDGWADRDPFTGNSGLVFPKGSGKTLVFQSGLLWGLKTDSLHVGGSTYASGLQPGKILSPGVAEDPNLPKNRIYRVRPDYAIADLASEVRDEGRTAAAVRAQYATDWNQWPATDGAPFDDRNSNGIYEPGIDVPGFKGADQTVWFVCNDLDTGRTRALYGSSPVGIEMQVTIWAYDRPGALGNMLFKNYRLINKSSVTFDSMFVSQWMDTDLGQFADDFAGCDTTLDLWFSYNSSNYDQDYGPLTPPAIGFQFPTMQAYAMIQKWSGTPFSDPPFGYEGTRQWYNWMRGLIPISGAPYIDPRFPGQPTRFWLDGDPLTATGRVDGYLAGPGDRRGHSTVGPWRMMPGEVRDVPVVVMAGFGSNNVTGIATLRKYSHAARSIFQGIQTSSPPKFSTTVSYPNATQVNVQIIADGRPTNARAITTTLLRQNEQSILSLPTFDDGLHGDSGSSDGIWGNSVMLNREQSALYMNATTIDNLGRTINWEQIYDQLTVSGDLQLEYRVVSDNLNNDGIVDAGENIRYGISIVNRTPFVLAPVFQSETKHIRRDGIMPGGADSMMYNPNDTLSYFSFTAPDSSETAVPFVITDSLYNAWHYELRFSIRPMRYKQYTTNVTHAAGKSEGEFSVLVVDLEKIQPHRYVIHIADSVNMAGETGFTLKDSTDGRILLDTHPLPDAIGHNILLTDGFKVLLSQNPKPGMKNWEIPGGTRRWTWTGADGLGLEGFEGAMGMGYRNWFSSSTVRPARLHDVLIKFAATDVSGNLLNPDDTTASYGYRYLQRANAPPARPEFAPFIVNPGPGYAFQEYRRGSVPFAAYDIETGGRRLMVGFLENNVPAGLVDGKYWPPYQVNNTAEDGPREFFFVFNVPYGATSDPSLQVDIQNEITPLMWFGTPNRRSANIAFQQSDEFLILASHVLSSDNVWIFSLDSIVQHFIPATFALSQNYPNPFNPTTTIGYQLPFEGRVTIKVYNILGQEVATLLDATQVLGFYSVQWNSRNVSGNPVASGVYFYRVEANAVSDGTKSFTQVKKMLLLR
jgi:hypothetical protein